MSHSDLHFYEVPAGSSLAGLAQRYITEILSPIATQLEKLDKSKFRFTHKNGEWRVKPQKGSGPSVTEEFAKTSHSISFPDFGTFVGKMPNTPDLGEASCFPSKNGVFFLACEKPLSHRLRKTCAIGRPDAFHFGENLIRKAGDHYVPTILQGITFHKEQIPAEHRKAGKHQDVTYHPAAA